MISRDSAETFADLGRPWRLEIRRLLNTHEPHSSAVEPSLAEADRKALRLAVIVRACTLFSIAFFYLGLYGNPNNTYIAALIVAAAVVGLPPLGFVRGPHSWRGVTRSPRLRRRWRLA